jgi:hypothetical protein
MIFSARIFCILRVLTPITIPPSLSLPALPGAVFYDYIIEQLKVSIFLLKKLLLCYIHPIYRPKLTRFTLR